MELPNPWWNSDILKVEKSVDGDELEVELNSAAPAQDSDVQAMIAIRFLLARHNIEPARVIVEFAPGADAIENLRWQLKGQAIENNDGSFEWGGFLFRAVPDKVQQCGACRASWLVGKPEWHKATCGAIGKVRRIG